MKSERLFGTLALVASGWLGGGCTLSAEGELPEVEVTEHEIAIPAAPLDSDGEDVTLPPVTFRQKTTRVGLRGASFTRVEIFGIQIAAGSGVSDLAFLTRLRVSATSPEEQALGRPPIVVGSYERGAATEVGPALEVTSDPPANVTQLWRSSDLIFTLEITGQLPTVAWTADVGLRFGATVNY